MNVVRLLSISFLASTSVSAMDIAPREEKIVIIGGGMAGLTAAYHLNQAHVPVALFEGRVRLGGRTHTHYFTDDKKCFYEEGGTFIDDDHYEALRLAKGLGVELKKNPFGTKKVTAIFNDNPEKLSSMIKVLGQVKDELKSQWKIIQNDNNAFMELKGEDLNSTWYAKPLLPCLSNLNTKAFGFLQCIYEDETGANIAHAPVDALPWLIETVSEYRSLLKYKNNSCVPNKFINKFAYNYTVKGGMSTFVDSLYQAISVQTPIHLYHILTKIEKEDSYVLTFLTQDGEKKIKAERVIMTLPFSTLRHVKIDASVGLSDLHHLAIQTLPYGMNGKIGVPTHASKNIYENMAYYLNLDDKSIGWAGENAVTLVAPADMGEKLDQDLAKTMAASQKDHICHEHSYIKDFGNVAFKNWAKDPFSMGCYSTATIDYMLMFDIPHADQSFAGMHAYAVPVDHFFFAGEHTRADGTSGHIEGAIRSGIKAAELVKASMKK